MRRTAACGRTGSGHSHTGTREQSNPPQGGEGGKTNSVSRETNSQRETVTTESPHTVADTVLALSLSPSTREMPHAALASPAHVHLVSNEQLLHTAVTGPAYEQFVLPRVAHRNHPY